MSKLENVMYVTLSLILLITATAFAQQSELAKPLEQLADQLSFANEGKVKAVSDGSIYINLGQQQGIREGMTFEVVRLGEPITSDGEIIGYQEKILGEAEVIRARKQISILEMVKPMAESKSVKKGDKVYQKKKKVKRIAITEFSFGDQFNQLTKNIEDRLYTAMIQRGMEVAERDRLTEILKEQKKEWSGLFDLSSAAELGKLLGVEAVLIGSVSDQGEQLSIRARLVDVETAQAIAAAATSVKETPNIANALGEGVRSKAVESMDQAGDREDRAEDGGGKAQDVLLSDDFEEEMSSEWRTESVGGSNLGVKDGQLTILGELKGGKQLRAFVGDSSWKDYILFTHVQFDEDPDPSSTWSIRPWQRNNQHHVALFVRVQDKHNMIGFFLKPGEKSGFRIKQNGIWSEMKSAGDTPKTYSYDVSVSVEGTKILASINGQLIATLENKALSQGYVGLQGAIAEVNYGDPIRVHFDNFEVTKIG